MPLQEIAAIVIVMVAAVYLIMRSYGALRKKNCASGCGACGTIDFAKIEAQIKAAEAKKK